MAGSMYFTVIVDNLPQTGHYNVNIENFVEILFVSTLSLSLSTMMSLNIMSNRILHRVPFI